MPNNKKLAGLEARALPSGIHEYSSTSIYLTHELNNQLHYGMARFRQVDRNNNALSIEAVNVDRLLVKMYSLGILVEPLKGQFWAPLQYLSFGWEHTKALDNALVSYLGNEDISVIEKLKSDLIPESLILPVPGSDHLSFGNHPLSKFPAVLSLVGPLIFPLYKAAILRKRVLIITSSSHGHSQLLSEQCSSRDPGTAGALAYLISLLSVVPKNVHLDLPCDDSLKVSRPIYSVGLSDLDSKFYERYPGYIATTGDEIMKSQTNVYDVALKFPAGNGICCDMTTSEEPDFPFKSTYNDYSKFLKLYLKLPQANLVETSTDDLASIKTSSSLLSILGMGYLGETKDLKFLWEPRWWLAEATSPMSWREYIWLAFSWFASAGATNREAETIDLESELRDEDLRNQMARLTTMVAQFHRLTQKWFDIIDNIVSEMVEYVLSDAQGLFVLELTVQDLVDLELDPYSLQDVEFVREFVLMYWGSVISDVDISFGFNGMCC